MATRPQKRGAFLHNKKSAGVNLLRIFYYSMVYKPYIAERMTSNEPVCVLSTSLTVK